MWREWIEERIAIKLIVAFNAYLERAIGHWSCHAEDDIAMVQLPVVQRDLPGLIHFTLGQLSCARDAAAVSATVRQIDALGAQAVEQRYAVVDRIDCTTPVGDGDRKSGKSAGRVR